MKNRCASRSSKSGFTLATVLAAVSVSTLLVVGVVNFSMQRVHQVKMLGERAKAITYSEAGLDYVYAQISEDFDLRNDSSMFPETSYGEGRFKIILSNVTSNSVLVTSIGYCGSASNLAAASVLNYADFQSSDEYDNSYQAWDYAVFSGGQISWSGSGDFNGSGTKLHSGQPFLLTGSGYVDADVYCPYEIELKGNASALYGDATAPSIKDTHGNISGTSTEDSVEPISFPSMDLTPYYQEALANGQVYDGDQDWDFTSDYSPPGGIIWVNGDVDLSGPGVVNACIIATGDVNSSLSGGMTRYSEYPTLISRDGDVKITSQGDYEGLVYVPSGDFAMQGGGSITGQIMVAGNVSKAGNSDAFTYVNSASVPPGGSDSEADDLIGISAWEK